VTGYELGLIAIVVGLLVGGAVRKASHGRGGAVYQTIAIFMTYAAIVFNYTPDLFKIIHERLPQPPQMIQTVRQDHPSNPVAADIRDVQVQPPTPPKATRRAPENDFLARWPKPARNVAAVAV